MKYILLSFLLLSACVNQSQQKTEVTNNNYEVELLFETDGCKVYRFKDGEWATSFRYFTNCTETISTVGCGKNCVRQENIGRGK